MKWKISKNELKIALFIFALFKPIVNCIHRVKDTYKHSLIPFKTVVTHLYGRKMKSSLTMNPRRESIKS